MPLLDEIARIAALRGKAPEHYVEANRNAERQRRTINSSQLDALFTGTPDADSDVRWFDRLPPASRRLLANLPLWASARRYADLLAQSQSEPMLIAAVQDWLPRVVQAWLLRHFGAHHPNVRPRNEGP